MHTTPEGTEDMNNAKAIAAATAHLVDTDQPATATRTRTTETGAGNQQRARADQPAEDGAREHTEPENTVPNRDTFIAALPAAVDEAMQKAIPHLYTPELAAQIVENMATELCNPQPTEPIHYPWCEPGACTSHRYEDGEVTTEHLGAKLVLPVPDGLDCYGNELLYAQLGYDENFVQAAPTASINSGGNGTLLDDGGLDKVIGDLTQFTDGLRAMRQQMTDAAGPNAGESVTAAQRGQDWMNKWGCTPWCVEEHGQTGALECHASAPNETQLRAADLDCTGYSENGRTLPWLSAQVIVCNEKPQAYGRETRVWMSYGVHVAEISPAQAREALDQMRAFTAQLAAVVDMADRVAADDFPGDPEVARLDKEATERRVKARTAELHAAEKAEVDDAVALFREGQATATPRVAAVMDEMADLIAKTGEPEAVVELVLDVIAEKRASA